MTAEYRYGRCVGCKRAQVNSTMFLQNRGCYIPKDHLICLGIEALRFLLDDSDGDTRTIVETVSHEEDHRSIHIVTGSARLSKGFDRIFYYPFERANYHDMVEKA